MNATELFALNRFRYSKPLYWLTLVCVVAAILVLPFLVFDQRQIGVFSIWEKPLKFFISTAIFSITYSWLSSFITRGTRWVTRLAWMISVAFVVELSLITGVAAMGQQSHFNVSSPTAIAVWSVMATMISLALIATVVMSVMILLEPKQPLILRLSLGLGSINTAIGMGLAFLMTSPSEEQLSNFQGIAGAHSVGTSDGGAGLPLLGWSVVAGDLRVGHFFGLHAIQVAIMFLLFQFFLPRPARFPLVIIGNVTYLGIVLTLTWQALRGESIVSPSPNTFLTLGILLGAAAAAFTVMVFTNTRLYRNRGSKSDITQKVDTRRK